MRRVTIACHLTLIAALAAVLLAAPTMPRLAFAAIVLAPLLLVLRGLAAGRRTTEQWLAVLLVVYIGGTSVEVVARSGSAPLLAIALLAAVLELGLLLALIRRPAAHG
jgi:uncharacterized membrane protein